MHSLSMRDFVDALSFVGDWLCPSCALQDLEETYLERLWGLSEMFPEKARENASAVAGHTWNGGAAVVQFVRSTVWILTSSAIVLSLPVVFEMERVNMDLARQQEEKQVSE